MAGLAITNTSPIIVLTRCGWIELMLAVADRIVVPAVVAEEIRRRGPDDPAADALATLTWLEIVETGPPDRRLGACRLDDGESAVLTWALAHAGVEAVLDDLPARRCAERLSIPYRGTLGVIVAAKLAGMIPSARAVIEDVRRAGLYISQRIAAQAVLYAGE